MSRPGRPPRHALVSHAMPPPAGSARRDTRPVTTKPLQKPPFKRVQAKPARACGPYLFTFYSVVDGKARAPLGQVDSRLLCDASSSGVPWDALVRQGNAAGHDNESWVRPGILYLSPRASQHVPVRTQATLDTALSTMAANSEVIVTTSAIAPPSASGAVKRLRVGSIAPRVRQEKWGRGSGASPICLSSDTESGDDATVSPGRKRQPTYESPLASTTVIESRVPEIADWWQTAKAFLVQGDRHDPRAVERAIELTQLSVDNLDVGPESEYAVTCLSAFFLNLRAVYAREQVRYGKRSDSRLHGPGPKTGATFIVAAATDTAAFTDAWVAKFGRHRAEAEQWDQGAWRPTLVVLDRDGRTTAHRHIQAGHVQDRMTAKEWEEILPLAGGWTRQTRVALGQGGPVYDWSCYETKYLEESDRGEHPHATYTMPSPTSTRYVILTTHESWRKEIHCAWGEAGENDPGYVNLKATCGVMESSPQTTAPTNLTAEHNMDTFKAEWVARRGPAQDGYGPLQARREMEWWSSADECHTYTHVVDRHHAAMLFVDGRGMGETERRECYDEPFCARLDPHQPRPWIVTMALVKGVDKLPAQDEKRLEAEACASTRASTATLQDTERFSSATVGPME